MLSRDSPSLRHSSAPEANVRIDGERAHLVLVHRRKTILAAVATATLAVGLSIVAALLVLSPMVVDGRAEHALAWNVEITGGGSASTTALVFGKGVGVGLVRVPAHGDTRSDPQVVSARLGSGSLHILSLDWSSLIAHAKSPPGAPQMSWNANGHFITAFENEKAMGVRAW